MEAGELESPIEPMTPDDTLYPIEDLNYRVFDKNADNLNVVDVYNIASSVGQEFERLTDAFGGAIFSGVMPKIIRILETLEILVVKRQEEINEIVELKAKVQKLQIDSKLKDEKQKEELEIVESTWRDETRDLLENIKTLEEDNQKMALLLTEKLQEENDNEVKFSASEQQVLLTAKLQEQIQKQRDEIRSKNRVIEEQNSEVDALQSQNQRLGQLNQSIRHKMVLLEQQGKSLIEEKSELESKLNEKDKTSLELQMKTLPSSQPSTPVHEKPATKCEQTGFDDGWPGDPLLANKLVIDLNDPDRPRYTLKELQEVLQQRNELKIKCFQLDEELRFHRGMAHKMGYDDSWEELKSNEIPDSKQTTQKTKSGDKGVRSFFSYFWSRPDTQTDGKQRPQAGETDVDGPVEKQSTLPGVTMPTEKEEEREPAELGTISPKEELDALTP